MVSCGLKRFVRYIYLVLDFLDHVQHDVLGGMYIAIVEYPHWLAGRT